jgi:hypothetical protein
MVKTLIRIAVALIVVHGAARVGSAFWNYYRYEDALLQIAQFSDKNTERQVCDEAMSTAAAYGVPITAAGLTVRKGNNPPFNCEDGPTALQASGSRTQSAQVSIDGTYTDRLQLFPGYYYPWEFKPTASARLRF